MSRAQTLKQSDKNAMPTHRNCLPLKRKILYHYQPPRAYVMPGSEGQDHRVCLYILWLSLSLSYHTFTVQGRLIRPIRQNLRKCKSVMLRQHELLPQESDHCSGILPNRPLCLSLIPCNAGHSKTRCCSMSSAHPLICLSSHVGGPLSTSMTTSSKNSKTTLA